MKSEYSLKSLDDTKNLACEIAKRVKCVDTILLKGDLGSGKTSFARFFINSFMDVEVLSPTFTLLNLYHAPEFDIYHYDLYRLEEFSECLELGIEDNLCSAVNIIEWPTLIMSILPKNYIELEFTVAEKGDRIVKISYFGKCKHYLEEQNGK